MGHYLYEHSELNAVSEFRNILSTTAIIPKDVVHISIKVESSRITNVPPNTVTFTFKVGWDVRAYKITNMC
jgi:hypothetical protein